MVIDRYRTGTAALGYTGDSVINSMSEYLNYGDWVLLMGVAGPGIGGALSSSRSSPCS